MYNWVADVPKIIGNSRDAIFLTWIITFYERLVVFEFKSQKKISVLRWNWSITEKSFLHKGNLIPLRNIPFFEYRYSLDSKAGSYTAMKARKIKISENKIFLRYKLLTYICNAFIFRLRRSLMKLLLIPILCKFQSVLQSSNQNNILRMRCWCTVITSQRSYFTYIRQNIESLEAYIL